MARRGWYASQREYNLARNGFEAVILPPKDGKRRLVIFSQYNPTVDLVDKEFTTLKEAKAYAEHALDDEPAVKLTPIK